MNPPDLLNALKPVIQALQTLGIEYYIGGSVASSSYGMPRTTMDVDMVSNLTTTHISDFLTLIQPTHYTSESMIREAIRRKSSFNLIHLETMIKVDIFILKPRSYDQQAFQRKIQGTLESDDSTSVFLGSPEDILLSKLEWYHLGNRTSERQWNDIMGIVEVQKNRLDLEYLKNWAGVLKVEDLLGIVLKTLEKL